MRKNALVSTITTTLLLLMLTACADDDQSNGAADKAAETSKTEVNAQPAENADRRPKRPQQTEPVAAQPQAMMGFQSAPIMSKPVDFSTPENVINSIGAIQKEAGDEASSHIESAIDYMLFYDLSVDRDKQKLYEKLDGKTPNQILGMMNR